MGAAASAAARRCVDRPPPRGPRTTIAELEPRFAAAIADRIRAAIARSSVMRRRYDANEPLSAGACLDYSHSIVPGGFDVMSYATRLMPATSLMMRDEILASRSYGSRAQSAVIASSDVTARTMIGWP
jgi:hypothetical protein